jgi:hypothetical protein
MRRLRRACPAILLIAAAACSRGELAPGVTDSTFVATMADLNRVRTGSLRDSGARSAARAEVLRKHAVTPEQLEEAARALADEPDRAAAVWQAIEERAARRDSAPRGRGDGARGDSAGTARGPRPKAAAP